MDHHFLTWAAFGFSLTGALTWFLSSLVRLPAFVPVGWDADGKSEAQRLSAMKLQGRLNAVAAFLTALGTLCQALSIGSQ
jgi:hypothetical protein